MKCVLVIDDSRVSAFLAETIFRRKGAKVLLAMNARTGLQLARTHLPDIVILDYSLPDMNGAEVCRSIKKNPQTRHIPILIVTDQTDKEALTECFQAGANDVLAKPFEDHDLVERVATLMRIPHRRYPRILVRMQVEKETEKGRFLGTIYNISEGGLLTHATEPLERGALLKVRFQLPGGSDVIEAECRVVRAESHPNVRGHAYGLEFIRLSEQDRERIRAFVQAHLQRSLTSSESVDSVWQ